MDDAVLTIGQVAAQAGVNTSAIRYYERIGLLPQPQRESGQRRYTQATVHRLGVIDVAKRAGLTLDDARALLATGEDGGSAHEEIRKLADRKLPEVDALIQRAEAMRRWLMAASDCGCETLDVCALFDAEPSGHLVHELALLRSEVGAQAFSEALAAEVAPLGVRVLVVEPGRPRAQSIAARQSVGISWSRRWAGGISSLVSRADPAPSRCTRLSVISAAPVGPRDEQPFLEGRVVMPVLDRFFGPTYADMRRMEAVLDDSRVDWVSLRPPRLVDKPATGAYRIAVDGSAGTGPQPAMRGCRHRAARRPRAR